MSYCILIGGENKGPYTIGQLRSMWNAGDITSKTLHCQEGDFEWQPLGSILHQLEPPPVIPNQTAPPTFSKAPGIAKPFNKTKAGNRFVFIFLGAFGFFIICGFFFIFSAPQASNQNSSLLNENPTNTSSSVGIAYYEIQIRQGILAVEPNHQFTPEEEAQIRNTAEEENKLHPKQ